MQTFKRILTTAAVFLTVFGVLMCGLFHCCYYSDNFYYLDRGARRELAGKLDCLISGASEGLCAFSPEVIDPILGCNSYNLSGSLMTVNGMCEITEQELERNPVKTVYINICFNTLTRDRSLELDEGEVFLIPRLDGVFHRIGYFLRWGNHKRYDILYSQLLERVVSADLQHLRGNNPHTGALNSELKGFYPQYELKDLTIPAEDIESLKDSVEHPVQPLAENLAQLDRLVKICEDHGANIVFVVTPISEAFLWKASNMDSVMRVYIDYSAAHGYDYIDFNLLKDRRELFRDSDSYRDDLHLLSDKAELFSARFAEVVSMMNAGENMEDMFFSSYAEMKEALPYG